jgi:hypothetical protein
LVNSAQQLIRSVFRIKTNISLYNVGSFWVATSGTELRRSSFSVPGDYEKRFSVETSGSLMGFQEPGETRG